jgi:AcrR family transcriptional regulator
MTAPRAQRAAEAEASSEAADAPVRRRRYLPAEERRKLIIQAAQEVFARSNLQGARTRDIAKAADINQATLFEHFESKEALFHEAVVNPLIEAMRGMQERAQAYQAAESLDDLLALAETSAQTHVESLVQVFPLLTAALFSDAELGRKLYNEQIVPLLKQRGEILDGILRETVDPEFAGLALFGVLFAVAMDQTFRGSTQEPADLARQVVQFSGLGFLKDSRRD